MKPKSIKFVAMTIQEAQQRLLFQLYHLYDNQEAANIADLVMEHLTGWKKIDRVVNKQVKLSLPLEQKLDDLTAQLATHKPVQYVLEEAWFYGMKLFVNEQVLIPRPETEELVEWILESNRARQQCVVLDVGTGSGCIAVALKKNFPRWDVHACDVSAGALAVAEKNAAAQGTGINFVEADILDRKSWETIPALDLLVSNPPYIPRSEMDSMSNNVVNYEPHTALFVESDDPLLFYKALGELGKYRLKRGGCVYVEIHENLSEETKNLFEKLGYEKVECRRDMQGKERMMRAFLPG